MSDFHKHFLQHIFEHAFDKLEGVESDEVGGSHFDLNAFGEKMELAKSANIDAMAFLERCHDHDHMSVKQALAAFDAEIAKIPPKS
ncbi:MAG: hypothetical protein ABSD98_12160 [Candidatus Korobacteraceae bacterium]|jgi:hypothetical protein